MYVLSLLFYPLTLAAIAIVVLIETIATDATYCTVSNASVEAHDVTTAEHPHFARGNLADSSRPACKESRGGICLNSV